MPKEGLSEQPNPSFDTTIKGVETVLAYCKSRNIDLQEKLANLALGQKLNMII